MLARLHGATAAIDRAGMDDPGVAPRIDLDVPERDRLEAALNELDRPWDAGPYAEETRRLLAARESDVRRWLADNDRLAAEQPADWVVTHGEPHPGNFLRTGSGLFLIDWNTVAVAPAERDLWMLTRRFAELAGTAPDGDDDLVLRRYEQLTGRSISDTALDLYPIRWTLYDIAVYVDELRRGEDLPESLTYLRGYLRPSR
ncbi:phosphotransferase [Actinoplanes sp. NPDC023714]|uniref:phosphotransferase n=1 Tax=Actinoplanes sp. NPDC023714 TaxID=3154322 RepID=UPI0033E05293